MFRAQPIRVSTIRGRTSLGHRCEPWSQCECPLNTNMVDPLDMAKYSGNASGFTHPQVFCTSKQEQTRLQQTFLASTSFVSKLAKNFRKSSAKVWRPFLEIGP